MSYQKIDHLVLAVTLALLALVVILGAAGVFGTHLAPDRCPAATLECFMQVNARLAQEGRR